MQYREKNKSSFFNTWNAWYVFVIIFLIAEIIIFYYLTKKFS